MAEKVKKVDFSTIKVLLYGEEDWKGTVKKLKSATEGMGVCAKVFKKGDIAWRCQDCEKDETCVMCQSCYEKSDHEGHRVWLNTEVGGCCDCGDPDSFIPSAFCSDHKGFEASTEAMLATLTPYLKESAPKVFSGLMIVLKPLLM